MQAVALMSITRLITTFWYAEADLCFIANLPMPAL
jgi:hypothetical protein